VKRLGPLLSVALAAASMASCGDDEPRAGAVAANGGASGASGGAGVGGTSTAGSAGASPQGGNAGSSGAPGGSAGTSGASGSAQAGSGGAGTGGSAGTSPVGGASGAAGAVLPPPVCDEPMPSGAPPKAQLTSLLTSLIYLVDVEFIPGQPSRMMLVDRTGALRILEDGKVLPTPFLDIGALAETGYVEQGLLGLAFHPDYAENGRFFVDYVDKTLMTRVMEYRRDPANPDRALPDAVGEVVSHPHETKFHNGGTIEVGPDGYLWIATGEGGPVAGHPVSPAADLGSLLGKMLRMDVSSMPYAPAPGNVQLDGARPEIWSYGLRNPWRFSFDLCTKDLWIADVGDTSREEIDLEPAGTASGRNYGWNVMEGSLCRTPGCDMSPYTLPVFEYAHDQGCSITGGHVYRGSRLPELRGKYVFGDWCSGILRWVEVKNGIAVGDGALLTMEGLAPTAFTEDPSGELYVLNGSGSVFRIDPVE
jgi:glucose/arabinose dehydrogenase